MTNDLSQSLREVLKRIKTELKTNTRTTRPATQRSMQQLQQWCEHYELATLPWFSANTVTFDRALMTRIEQTLAELGLHSLAVDIRQQDRFAQSDHSPVEHKTTGLTPTERRVLMAQANCGAYFPEWVSTVPAQWVMDLDWETLNLETYHSLVVVENRDSFYEYYAQHPQRYQLPEQAFTALVIYRGDQQESKGCQALLAAFATTGKPIIYFGDYDSAGLNFALHGLYSHTMLPDFAYLQAKANDPGQPAKQLELSHSVKQYAEHLPADHPIKAYLLHNTQQQKGLRQQAFKGQLQILPLR
jgi:hypothetical protein